MKKQKLIIPSAEELIEKVKVPSELRFLEGFQEAWEEWCFYKQQEAMDDRSQTLKPWRTVMAGQREMSHIRNEYLKGRDVVNVINQSLLRQWIGIRFDLISDRNQVPSLKSKEQVSDLDLEFQRLNSNQLN